MSRGAGSRRFSWLQLAAVVLVLPVVVALRSVPRPVWEILADVVVLVARVYVFLSMHAGLLVLVLGSVIPGRLVLAAVRFARLPAGARRYWLPARWCSVRWRWLARNLGLSYEDQHRRAIRPVVFGTAAPLSSGKPARRRVRFPRARFRPDPHGVVVTVKTIPNVGRAEFEAATEHIANAWNCARVSVSQPSPGRLIVRGLRRDPLLELLTLADVPPSDMACPHRVWLGRDEHGEDRWLDLRNISGICVGGQPGGGKSQGITSWETQLAPSPAVQFANVDGKGAGEFDDFEARAWITAGDSMDRMLVVLEMLTGLMYDRLATVRDYTGGLKNIWTVGVSEAWPLQFSVFDETQSFFDMPAAKALGKDAEKACAQAIKLGGELVRKGRSVGMCSVFATQKPTTDSLPSSISSNCALSVAFSLKTLDAAKATLGADIGDYPSLSPVTLSLPDYAGVCVVSLRDGMSPFTKLRSPMVTEDQAAAVASASAHLRRDPRASVPIVVPDDASSLAPELQ